MKLYVNWFHRCVIPSNWDKVRSQFNNRVEGFFNGPKGAQKSRSPRVAGFGPFGPKYGPNIAIECFSTDWDHTSAGGGQGGGGRGR